MWPSAKWRTGIRIAFFIICGELAFAFAFDGIHRHFVPVPPGLLNKLGAYYGHDFLPFYAAAEMTLRGEAVQAYDVAAIHLVEREIIGQELAYAPWVYPPTFLLFLLPFAFLPYVSSYIAWSVANIAAGVAAGWIAVRQWWVAVIAILSPVTWLNVFSGQNGGITAGLMLAGLGLLRRQPVLSGVLFGLTSYKPQLAILIPVALAAGRYWTCLFAAAASAVVLALASYLAFGIEPWAAFVALMTNAAGSENIVAVMASDMKRLDVPPLWSNSVSVFAMARLAGLDPFGATVVQALSAILAGALVFYVWARKAPFDLRATVLVIATLLATPRALIYDSAILIIPAIYIFGRLVRSTAAVGDWIFLGAFWLFPIVAFFLIQRTGFQFWPVVLWGALLYGLLRFREPSHSGDGVRAAAT